MIRVQKTNNLILYTAFCFENGEGTDENKTKAFELYEKSTNLGFCIAMKNVGGFYQHGFGGVTKDLKKAREWYTNAAVQGDTDAKTRLDELNQ